MNEGHFNYAIAVTSSSTLSLQSQVCQFYRLVQMTSSLPLNHTDSRYSQENACSLVCDYIHGVNQLHA